MEVQQSDADRYNLNPSKQTHKHRRTHARTRPHRYTALQGTHLEVSVYHPHLMAVEHGLQDLLDAVTARKQQGEQVSLSTSSPQLTVTSMQRQRCLCAGHTHRITTIAVAHAHRYLRNMISHTRTTFRRHTHTIKLKSEPVCELCYFLLFEDGPNISQAVWEEAAAPCGRHCV